MPEVKLKKTAPDAILPTYGSDGAAGADLYALPDGDVTLAPGETKLIRTGIALAIPEGYVGLIFARSGLAAKQGLAPANKVGGIDCDYRGEILVALHNHSDAVRTVAGGERVAQLVLTPYVKGTFRPVEELDETVRGAGGFGSTGSK